MSIGDIQWNFDITKGEETFKNLFAVTRFRYIDRGFFSIYFTIDWVNKIVRYP